MRAAADGEDGSVKHVAMENRLYPLRELLANCCSRPASRRPPRRVRDRPQADAQPLPRAARDGARRQCGGRSAKASEYYGKLVELAKNADTERPEIREAKEFLARK